MVLSARNRRDESQFPRRFERRIPLDVFTIHRHANVRPILAGCDAFHDLPWCLALGIFHLLLLKAESIAGLGEGENGQAHARTTKDARLIRQASS